MRQDRGRYQEYTRTDGASRRGQRSGTGRPVRGFQAGTGREPRSPLSGLAHHGRVPGIWRQLPRHGQLRAARRGEIRIQLAMGL